MAIPQGRLSTTLVEGNFLAPDNLEKGGLTDYEMGPIDINDTTQGLLYQVWTATWDPNTANFGVVSDDGKVYSSIHNAVDVTHVSFCFDQNGRPTLAYVSESIPYLYWYDTQQSETTITPLDYTIRTPFLTLDDKRATQSQSNDILLFYKNMC